MSIADTPTKTVEAVADVVQTVAEGVVDLATEGVDMVSSITGNGRSSKKWYWAVLAMVLFGALAAARSRRDNKTSSEVGTDARPVRAA